MKSIYLVFSIFFISLHCDNSNEKTKEFHIEEPVVVSKTDSKSNNEALVYDEKIPTIHIMVALCDNENQGIVPVPKAIGNGQDPKNNLYWGAMYGMKTYFKNSKDWKLIKSETGTFPVLERLIFKHAKKNYYLIADAYDGKYIKQATEDFLESSAGIKKDVVNIEDLSLGINGNAKLIGYVGHNGLMDFKMEDSYQNTDGKTRDIMILACFSSDYFKPHLQQAKVRPLVWSTHFMAPEAYVVHGALQGYVNGETPEQISERAAIQYAKYQKCGVNAARNLLTSK